MNKLNGKDMSEAVRDAVQAAIPGAVVTPDVQTSGYLQHVPVIPSHVADNICKLLQRVQVTGIEAVAWVEAFEVIRQLVKNPSVGQQALPGAPFSGIGQK